METVKISGAREIINNMEKVAVKNKVRKMTRNAINAGAQLVEKEVKQNIKPFRDTGATYNEVVLTNAAYTAGQAHAKLGWNGPKQRYRLIHLEEWGYTRKGKQFRPRTFGAIGKTLTQSQTAYLSTVEQVLRSQL